MNKIKIALLGLLFLHCPLSITRPEVESYSSWEKELEKDIEQEGVMEKDKPFYILRLLQGSLQIVQSAENNLRAYRNYLSNVYLDTHKRASIEDSMRAVLQHREECKIIAAYEYTYLRRFLRAASQDSVYTYDSIDHAWVNVLLWRERLIDFHLKFYNFDSEIPHLMEIIITGPSKE